MNRFLLGGMVVSGFFVGFLLVYWAALKMPRNNQQKQENSNILIVIDQTYTNDSADDIFQRGKKLWAHKKYQESVKVLRAAFQKVSLELRLPIARYLGEAYLFGKGVPKNPDQSFKYYTLKGMPNNGWTALRLGQIYREKSFSGYDLQKAKNYFLRAKKDKIATATWELKKMNP